MIVSGLYGNHESSLVHEPKSKFQIPGLVPVDSSLVNVYYQTLLVQLNNFVAVHEYCALYKKGKFTSWSIMFEHVLSSIFLNP